MHSKEKQMNLSSSPSARAFEGQKAPKMRSHYLEQIDMIYITSLGDFKLLKSKVAYLVEK